MPSIDLLQLGLTGFASGIGTGLANWLLIKRLDMIENRIRGKPK